MRVFPIDSARAGRFQFVQAVPKRGEGGQQAVSAVGFPRWTIQALLTPPPAPGFEPKATLEEVTIAQLGQPELTPLSEVYFIGLTARPWSMNGRSGVALSAEEVRAA